MKNAFVFPGQGSQFVGMGKDLADSFASAREVFQEVDSTLNQNLFQLMTSGPEYELTMTVNTQPALMAVSMAVVRVLEKEFGINLKDKAAFVAGHSLGEYSAACAAGVFSLADTARLLRARSDAMQKAVPLGVGGMAAVIGLSYNEVSSLVEACADANNLCVAANDNSEGQVVLSGHMAAIDKAIEIARGVRRQTLYKTSGQCAFSQPADAAGRRSYGKSLHGSAGASGANSVDSQRSGSSSKQ